MNKLITDRPSEWKDWMIEQIDAIESELDGMPMELHSIGLVILPVNIRRDNALTAFYNAGYIDRVIMSQHLHFDAVDTFMDANIEKYMPNEIVFEKNDENDENEIEGGEYQDEDVKKG